MATPPQVNTVLLFPIAVPKLSNTYTADGYSGNVVEVTYEGTPCYEKAPAYKAPAYFAPAPAYRLAPAPTYKAAPATTTTTTPAPAPLPAYKAAPAPSYSS